MILFKLILIYISLFISTIKANEYIVNKKSGFYVFGRCGEFEKHRPLKFKYLDSETPSLSDIINFFKNNKSCVKSQVTIDHEQENKELEWDDYHTCITCLYFNIRNGKNNILKTKSFQSEDLMLN